METVKKKTPFKTNFVEAGTAGQRFLISNSAPASVICCCTIVQSRHLSLPLSLVFSTSTVNVRMLDFLQDYNNFILYIQVS